MTKFPIPLSTMSLVTKIAVVGLALAFISEQTAAIKALPFEIGEASHNFWMIPAFWVGLLAPGFYLCALWAASDVFASLDKGEGFGPSLIKGLKGMGSNLIYGAFAAIIIAPSLQPLFEGYFRGLRHDFEIENLTIGLIGVVLWLITAQGAKLQTEMDSFV
jgi:hypothetical protein